MRLRLVVYLFLWVLVARAFSAALPLTVKEISLMLRTGYSNEAVLKELSERHFADTVDAAKEELLQQAGANADLLSSLKTGAFSLSREQTAAAQQQLLEAANRREAEGERLRFNTLYRDQVAQSRSGGVVRTNVGGQNAIHDLVKDDLISLQHGSLTHFDDSDLENKKLIGFYFSAHWCGPCRKFTPQLVDYYNRVAPQHPELEIIFVSSDKSPFEMETYMREMNMPWPAVEFQKVTSKTEIKKYAGSGIPCLVVVDATGKVVSDSFQGSKYVGPQKVLADLDGIFAHSNVAQLH